jgi:hypothetical protein
LTKYKKVINLLSNEMESRSGAISSLRTFRKAEKQGACFTVFY